MATSERRHTEKRNFEGEEVCTRVLDWINRPPTDEEMAQDPEFGARVADQIGRIRELLQDLLRLHELWRKERDEQPQPERAEFKETETAQAVTELTTKLAGKLKRYPTVHYILPGRELYVGTAQLWPDQIHGEIYEPVWPEIPDKMDEFLAVSALMRIVSNGWLPKIARCECGRLFFKRFSHQTSHSADCRKKTRLASEEWREYNRRKQREYYHLHRHKNVK